jgi:hypothetical protein
MSEQEPSFPTKMASLGFQPNSPGLGMVCNVSGVKIVAVESPLGIHLHFTRFTPRTMTQFEVQAPSSCSAPELAGLIVKNLESAFPDIAGAKKA